MEVALNLQIMLLSVFCQESFSWSPVIFLRGADGGTNRDYKSLACGHHKAEVCHIRTFKPHSIEHHTVEVCHIYIRATERRCKLGQDSWFSLALAYSVAPFSGQKSAEE